MAETTFLDKLFKRHRKRQESTNKEQSQVNAVLEDLSKKSNPTAEDLQAAMDEINKLPHGKQLAANKLRQEQIAAGQGRFSPVLKTLLSLTGVGASLGQINKANALRGALVQPSIPTPPGIDPVLDQQIFSAQRGTMDAGRASAAANVGINDAYNQAVQEATNTAGGQAGTRSALINRANLNKMRASVGELPMLDAIRAREEGRADQLVGQRSQLAQQAYGNQLNATQMALNQYNQNSQSIGALGAIGHENLFGQLQGLSDTVIPTIGAFSNPYASTEPGHSDYESEHSSKYSAYDNYLNAENKRHVYRAKRMAPGLYKKYDFPSNYGREMAEPKLNLPYINNYGS